MRAYVLTPYSWQRDSAVAGSIHRDPESRLEEALGLASAIDVDLLGGELVDTRTIQPSTFFGGGKVEQLKTRVESEGIGLYVVDAALTPIQQRNLETRLKTKVIDRTGLILEIFGARASTREGVMQVELAHLSYQKSRLVRSWTHLERQRGGAGFLGGPGERQIESDRRMLDEKIVRLKRQLEDVRRTRSLHRQSRKQSPHPVVALVGYTNAGKSTLFNRLTGAGVLSADQLFATLDPTLRNIILPSGKKVILSDTVGFVADLPTLLVAAFRATLEEVLEADLILHVRNSAAPDFQAQYEDVINVLGELGVPAMDEGGTPTIEVLNKSDLLDDETLSLILDRAERTGQELATVSALTGEGCAALIDRIDAHFRADDIWVSRFVPYSDGKTLAAIEAHGDIEQRREVGEGVWITLRISPIDFGRLDR